MRVKIKLGKGGQMPTKADKLSAGYDLYASTDAIETRINDDVFMDKYYEYGTGIYLEIPKGYYGQIHPRSSISNRGLVLCNSVGVIDSSYRGEIRFRFNSVLKCPELYKKSERIGQLIILPYPEIKFVPVEELTSTKRGSGGFGSSGK